ncbi:hypothetical protein BDW69DRAFT_189566 [Aspergillus filifer]
MAANAIDLAGVVGTWIAVFFAILALVGVVGPLLIYMNQRSQRTVALENVDDPARVYIGPGVRLCCSRARALRTVKVPILTTSPNIPNLFSVMDNGRKMRSTASTTGWIMLSDVLWNYNFDLKYGDGLKFAETESYLPVHKNWILLLGLLGRYGVRKDNGLPIGEIGNIPSVFLNASEEDYFRLSGTSGTMLVPLRSSPTTKLRFHFHRHMLDGVALDKKDLPLEHLLFLYLGYLPSRDGILFGREQYDSYKTDPEKEFFRFLPIPSDKLDVSHRLLFRQLGVYVQSVFRFEAVESKPDDMNKIIDEAGCAFRGPTRDSMRLSRYFKSRTFDAYYIKADIHRLNLRALEVEWSPYAVVWRGGENIFDSASLDSNKDRIMSALDRLLGELPASPDNDRLIEFLRRASELPTTLDQFSRTASRLWYDIDLELRKYWRTEGISMRAVSLLFLDFPELAETLADGLRSATVDMDSNTVTFAGEGTNQPDPAPFEWTYFFDFESVFTKEQTSGHVLRVELSITQCAIAALQALVRVAMFDCVVSSDALSVAFDALNDIVWVADSTSGVAHSFVTSYIRRRMSSEHSSS